MNDLVHNIAALRDLPSLTATDHHYSINFADPHPDRFAEEGHGRNRNADGAPGVILGYDVHDNPVVYPDSYTDTHLIITGRSRGLSSLTNSVARGMQLIPSLSLPDEISSGYFSIGGDRPSHEHRYSRMTGSLENYGGDLVELFERLGMAHGHRGISDPGHQSVSDTDDSDETAHDLLVITNLRDSARDAGELYDLRKWINRLVAQAPSWTATKLLIQAYRPQYLINVPNLRTNAVISLKQDGHHNSCVAIGRPGAELLRDNEAILRLPNSEPIPFRF